MRENISEYQPHHAGLYYIVIPTLDEPRERDPDRAAEERWALRILLFEVTRDFPRARHGLAVVNQNRDAILAGESDRVLLGEAPRHGFNLETLVRNSKSDTPAEGAEPTLGLRASQVVHDESHGNPSAPEHG